MEGLRQHVSTLRFLQLNQRLRLLTDLSTTVSSVSSVSTRSPAAGMADKQGFEPNGQSATSEAKARPMHAKVVKFSVSVFFVFLCCHP